MVITELLAPTDLEPDLADRMRIVMRRRRATNADIAHAMEVSANSVSNWINGNTRPRRRDLVEFARVTGAPVDWLETGKAPICEDEGQSYAPRDLNPEPADYGTAHDGGLELINLPSIPNTVGELLAMIQEVSR